MQLSDKDKEILINNSNIPNAEIEADIQDTRREVNKMSIDIKLIQADMEERNAFIMKLINLLQLREPIL